MNRSTGPYEPVPLLQVGMNGMEAYQADFEEALLNETAVYYKRQAARWITEDSLPGLHDQG